MQNISEVKAEGSDDHESPNVPPSSVAYNVHDQPQQFHADSSSVNDGPPSVEYNVHDQRLHPDPPYPDYEYEEPNDVISLQDPFKDF